MKKFEDIKWKQHQLGKGSIQGLLMLDSGNELSIVAGPGMYCMPKEQHNSPDSFSSFEVAVFDKEGKMMGDPTGWQSRDNINTLIKLLS